MCWHRGHHGGATAATAAPDSYGSTCGCTHSGADRNPRWANSGTHRITSSGARRVAGAMGKHVVWSSDSDDDVARSDDEDEDDGEDGVKPVVLQDRHTQANKPKTADFRKQHLYGARLNRQNGLLALARRTKGRLGPSSRF